MSTYYRNCVFANSIVSFAPLPGDAATAGLPEVLCDVPAAGRSERGKAGERVSEPKGENSLAFDFQYEYVSSLAVKVRCALPVRTLPRRRE